MRQDFADHAEIEEDSMDFTQVSAGDAGTASNEQRARTLAELTLYSTLEAGAIVPGLIVTRGVKDIDEAYKLFEQAREFSVARLWERLSRPVEMSEKKAE
jgi:hypothetical protein